MISILRVPMLAPRPLEVTTFSITSPHNSRLQLTCRFLSGPSSSTNERVSKSCLLPKECRGTGGRNVLNRASLLKSCRERRRASCPCSGREVAASLIWLSSAGRTAFPEDRHGEWVLGICTGPLKVTGGWDDCKHGD